MAVKAEFYFDDVDPVIRCECGWHTHGDAVMDATTDWARHLTSGAHPES